MKKNGQSSFSIGTGRRTFIEKRLTTRFMSIMAIVQMVNFLMSWLRLWETIEARASMSPAITWV